jgi:hypothetical protein
MMVKYLDLSDHLNNPHAKAYSFAFNGTMTHQDGIFRRTLPIARSLRGKKMANNRADDDWRGCRPSPLVGISGVDGKMSSVRLVQTYERRNLIYASGWYFSPRGTDHGACRDALV